VASYGVDIEIALQGAQKITELTRGIKSLNKEVDEINKEAKRLGKEIDKAFRVDSIQNYSRALNQAERALRNVASSTDAERKAVERVVRMRREANDALARQNMLLAQATANQRTAIATANAGFGMQGPSLPKDFFKVQGPKLPPGFTETGRKPKTAPRISAGDRIGAAVSAGAFPLLFGGGPGMALGGAVGGAAAGATFGPAAIALQVLGGAVDQFVAQTAVLGQALNELTFDFDAVIAGAGFTGTELEKFVKQIEEFGDATEAQELATKLLAIRIGTKGVDALKRFGDSTSELNREFSVSMSALGAAVASASTPVTDFITDLLKASNQLRAGRQNATNDAELKALGAREQQLLAPAVPGSPEGFDLEKAIELEKVQQQIRDRHAEIQFIAQETARIRAEDLQRLDNELSIQTDNLHVLALRRELLQNGKTLSAEELAIAKENIAKGRIQVKRERLLVEQAQLIERAKRGELSFRKVALIIAGKQLEIDEALQKLETKKDKKDKEGPRSRALQLQAALLREKLKQFGIEMDVQSLNETRIKSLQRQNQGIEERRDKELQILELQKQQEVANNKVPGDLQHINRLYEARKQTIRDTLGLELDQNNARINAIELQEKLTRIRAGQKTAGIGRGLRRQIADTQRSVANPFDSNELQMLQLRVDQVRRADDAYQGLNDKILENTAIIEDNRSTKDQIKQAKEENEILKDRVNIYRDLLPQLDAVEQAQLRQQQIIDQLTPATEAFAGALVDTVTGAQTAQEAFANFLRSVANMLADTAKKMIAEYIAIGIARMFAGMPGFNSPAASPGGSAGVAGIGGGMTNPFGNTSSFGVPFGVRANGGPVSSGQPYLVGERGPEMFVPGAQGNIVPNNAMGGGANVTVNVDASGSSVEGDGDQAAQLGKAIGIAVQQELIKQKRPGGLLTR